MKTHLYLCREIASLLSEHKIKVEEQPGERVGIQKAQISRLEKEQASSHCLLSTVYFRLSASAQVFSTWVWMARSFYGEKQ